MKESRSSRAARAAGKGAKTVHPHPLVSCRISVFWEGENKYFRGKVTREVCSSVFHVEYDDGEAHDENLREDSFKWHGPRASSAAEPYHASMRPVMLDLGAVNARSEEIEVASTLSSHNGKVPEPHGGIPHLSEAVGWRIRFWWVGTCEWVEGEVLSYRATDSRHLVLFADGESEWMSVSGETIWWLANTRERGNRLTPLGYGLDGAAIPKGRDAIEWRVDIYDRSLNQFLRAEIAEFNSVTGKHKVEYTNGHKPQWLSLTASKIIWRFPPGLPAPASEPPTPREDTEQKPPAPQPPVVPAKRSRSSNVGRKSSQTAVNVDLAAPEGGTVPPKQKSRKISNPTSPKAKGGKSRASTSDAVFVRADSTVAIASDKGHPRAQEKKTSPSHPVPSQLQPSLHRSSSDAAAAAPARTAPATEHVTKKQRSASIKPQQIPAVHVAAVDRAMGGKGSVAAHPSVPFPQQPAVPAAALRPVSSNVAPKPQLPATVHRHSLRTPLASTVLRPAPFTQVSMVPHTSLLKSSKSFVDVRTLLEATQRRAAFIKDVLQLLDRLESTPAAPGNLQPTPHHLPSPASTPALPTDPRRQPCATKSPAQPSAVVDAPSHKTPGGPKPPTRDAVMSRVGASIAEDTAAAPASLPARGPHPGSAPPRFPKREASNPLPPSSDKQSEAALKPCPVNPAAVVPAASDHIPFTPRFAPLSAIVHTAHALASGASVAAVTPAPSSPHPVVGSAGLAMSREAVSRCHGAHVQPRAHLGAVNAVDTASAMQADQVPALPRPAFGPQASQRIPLPLGTGLPQLSVMQQAYMPSKHARPPAVQRPPAHGGVSPAPPDQTSSSGKQGGDKDTDAVVGKVTASSETSPCSDALCSRDKNRSYSVEVEPVIGKGNVMDGPISAVVDANEENGNANCPHRNGSSAGPAAQSVKLARDSNGVLESVAQDTDVEALNKSSPNMSMLTSRLRWAGMPFGRVPALGLKGGGPATAAGSAGGRACG